MKIDNNTCTICLERHQLYNSMKFFNFPPILFDRMKKYGFSTMHKRVRNFEFQWKGAERKESKLTGVNLKTVRHNWQTELQELTGIDPFRPDPINRGNTNDGNLSRRFHQEPFLSSSVVKLNSKIIALMGVLLDMLNSTYFQDPKTYRALAIVTHKLIVNDLGDYMNISGCVHSTLCHGDLFIRYAQAELGVPLGFLTENSIEMGNKDNKQYKQIFSRKNDLGKETKYVFVRRLIMSDPILNIDEATIQNYKNV